MDTSPRNLRLARTEVVHCEDFVAVNAHAAFCGRFELAGEVGGEEVGYGGGDGGVY